jgi:hypothetical protein
LGNGAHLSIAGTGHFNSDATADLLWQNMDGTLGFWLMNGASITSATAAPPGTSWHIVADDFSGDGKSDVVWENSGYTPGDLADERARACRAGAPCRTLAHPNLKTADFDGDGESDILLDNDAGTLSSG